eukprot:1343229-Alexandrium_andersonii.AAC.1
MTEWGLRSSYKHFMEEHSDFLRLALDNEKVARWNNAIIVCCKEHFESTVGVPILRMVLLELLKTVAPKFQQPAAQFPASSSSSSLAIAGESVGKIEQCLLS